MHRFKSLTILILSLSVSLSLGLAAHTTLAQSNPGLLAAQYLLSKQSASGDIGGFQISGWAMMGLAANQVANQALSNYLEQNSASLTSASATDIERTILALIAAGKNPYQAAGLDLVALLKSKAQNNQIGSPSLVNDDMFGVLALLASQVGPNDPLVQGSLQLIGRAQRADGSVGWSTSGAGDSNNTAVAIQTMKLAQQFGYQTTIDLDKAVTYLKRTQNTDGGFSYQPGQESDGASTSWVIQAILSLGQDPFDWQADEGDPYTFLESLQDQSTGGVFWRFNEEDIDPDLLITSYAAMAYAGKPLPVALLAIQPSPSPSPSPIPSPSPTPSPSPIPSPSPSPVPSPIHTPSPSPSPVPSPIPTPSPSLVPSPSPSFVPSPTPSAIASPSPSPTILPSPSPTPTPNPQPSPSVQPTSSPSPQPSASPQPSSSPSTQAAPSPQPSPTPSSQTTTTITSTNSPVPTVVTNQNAPASATVTTETSPTTTTTATTATVVSNPNGPVRQMAQQTTVSNTSSPQPLTSPTPNPTVTTEPTPTPSGQVNGITDTLADDSLALAETEPSNRSDKLRAWTLPIVMVLLGLGLTIWGIKELLVPASIRYNKKV